VSETSAEMLQLRFHFGERDRDGDGPLEAAVMDACARRGVWAAALMRGVEGFGAKQHLRTDRLLSLSEDTPLVAVAVGEAAVIEGLVDDVRGIAAEGLMVLETTTTATVDGGERDLVKATVWGPRTGPTAPHLEAVAALRRHGAESATVLLGVDGVLEGERRRARFVAGNRGVPAMTVGVGERAAIESAVAAVDGAAHLVTFEPVETFRRIGTVSLHTEEGVEPKLRIPPLSLHGDAAVRVTLVTSEVASRGRHPAYLELIHQLRREGAAGATALRGVWGYRGDREPHGDRVLALRRDVPLLVEVVDAPERAARWVDLARSLGGEGDVVQVQEVPRAITLK
jgi:PII-like signaling protein